MTYVRDLIPMMNKTIVVIGPIWVFSERPLHDKFHSNNTPQARI